MKEVIFLKSIKFKILHLLPFFYIYFFLIIPKIKLHSNLPNLLFFLYILILEWLSRGDNSPVWEKKKLRKLVLFVYSVFFLHLALLQLNHLESFFLGDNDVVSITEVLFETARGNFFKSHHFGNSETENFLSHHFSPGFLLYLPFIYLFPIKMIYPISLLVFSALGLIFYEKIIYRIVPKKLPYLIFSLIPLSNPTLYDLITSYHFEIMYIPFFMIFFYGGLKNSIIIQIFGILGCVTVKEDIPLYISIYFFFIGVLQLISSKSVINSLFKKNPNLGNLKFGGIFYKNKNSFFLLLSLLSLAYFSLIPKIQSTLDPSTSVNWLQGWSQYGTTKLEIFNYFLNYPSEIVWIFFENQDIFFKLIHEGGFFLVFSLPEFLSFLIIFIIQSSSSRIWYNQFHNYYSYTVLPFLLLGNILGYLRISNFKNREWLAILVLGISLHHGSLEKRFPQHFREVDKRKIAILKDVVSKIPPNSRVSTQFYLGMFLEGTHLVYPIQKESNKEFILVDTEGLSPYINIHNLIERLEENENYFVYYTNQTVKLYRKLD